MSVPISPFTVNAALQLAQRTTQVIGETLQEGASFAQHLLATPTQATQTTIDREQAGQRLSELHTKLIERLSQSGVDLGFRVDVTSTGGQLTLANVHPDHEQIQAALQSDSELQALFGEVQQLLAKLNPGAGPQSSLRIHLKADEIGFDFGG